MSNRSNKLDLFNSKHDLNTYFYKYQPWMNGQKYGPQFS